MISALQKFTIFQKIIDAERNNIDFLKNLFYIKLSHFEKKPCLEPASNIDVLSA